MRRVRDKAGTPVSVVRGSGSRGMGADALATELGAVIAKLL